jgi:hypothetical protein
LGAAEIQLSGTGSDEESTGRHKKEGFVMVTANATNPTELSAATPAETSASSVKKKRKYYSERLSHG